MKQKKFIRISISICIIAILTAGIYTVACGPWYDPDSTNISLFDKALSDAPNTRPFYYSYYSLFDDNSFEADNQTNIAEWKTFTLGFAKEKDISEIVYKTLAKQLINIKSDLSANRIPFIDDTLKGNTFLQYLINKKDITTINYLIYAKSCEPFVNINYDDLWNYKPLEISKVDTLLNNGLIAYKHTQNQFLKLRYAFQAQRLAHYSQQYERCISIYDSLISPLTVKSDVNNWCLSLKAGALLKVNQQPLSVYLFSKVFDKCPKYRLEAYKSIWFFSNINEDSVLNFCVDKHEKAVFYSMMAFNSPLPDTLYINRIYQLEPKSLDLEVLLIREISKIEEKLTSIQESELDIANDIIFTADAINAAGLLKQRVAQIADAGNTANPALWFIALAYISYLQKDFKAADIYLNKIDVNSLNTKLNTQYNVVKILVEITKNERITATTESIIFPYINSLRAGFSYRKGINNSEGYDEVSSLQFIFADRAYATLMTEVLSRSYAHQGDMIKALICMSVGEFDASYYPTTYYSESFLNSATFKIMDSKTSTDQLLAILQFMDSPRNNEYDNFICNHSGIDRSSLIELIGTKFIRLSDFGNAVSVLSINPEDRKDDIGNYIDANPFGDTISESHAKTSADTVIYTKLSFAKRMFELENLLKSDPANATSYYYQLANAYYNISYYGNSWAISQYNRSTSETEYLDKSLKTNNDYYNTKKALTYFIKAMSSSDNKEFKARCTMLASKSFLSQSTLYNYNGDKDKYDPGEYFTNNPYFTSLYKDYRKTAFYKQTIGQCTYLKDFVEIYKKK